MAAHPDEAASIKTEYELNKVAPSDTEPIRKRSEEQKVSFILF